MRILMKPNDVLMFREAKPYTAGEDHIARSVYPLPQTIAGALRSAILLSSNFSEEAKEFAGYRQEEPNFEILGHFFFDGEEYFPTPLDIAKAKGLEGYFFVKPLPLWNGSFIFKGKHIHFGSVGGFLGYDDLVKYLMDDLREEELEDAVKKNPFVREGRVGIKLTDAKITEERHFYKAEFLRLGEDVSISVWIGENGERLKEFLKDGLIRLGGESRFARFEVEDENPLDKIEKVWDEIKERINRGKMFKLYIATPLLIKNGNCYTWDVKSILESKLKIKSIYPLVGKPLAFSGWDYVEKKPKPTRYAVPPGSVYFVEFEGKIELEKPYLKLGELTKLGFGLCFLGVW